MLIRSRILRRTSLVRSTKLAAKKLFTVIALLILLVSSVSSTALFNSNTSNAVAQAPAAGVWDQVATGSYHTCGIAYGEVYCWGENERGQLGDGTVIPARETPVKVTQAEGLLAGRAIAEVAVGYSHSCALAEGEVYCWGGNGGGQLGDGTTTQRTTPVKVAQAEGLLAGKIVTQISAGGSQTCAIAQGESYCWGTNNNGQLGDGSTTQRTTPVKVVQAEGLLAGKIVTSVSTASGHTCAVASSEAYCWGINTNSQLGDGTATRRTTPVKVTQAEGVLAGKTVTQVAAGTSHTCAIANSESYCWGNNTSGRLGDGTETQRTSPVKVIQAEGLLAGKVVTQITAGDAQSCALTEGELSCWGGNADGQLGSGDTTNSLAPIKVAQAAGLLADRTVTQLAANANHACAIAGGEIYCWGDNWYSQLGHASNNFALSPSVLSDAARAVFSGKTISQVSGGESHSCAIADGEVYCWGSNYSGAVGDSTTVSRSSPVKVTQTEGVLAGKTVTQISTGNYHTCAIADGEAYCWGDNYTGAVGDGTTVFKTSPVKVTQTEGVLAGKTVTQITAGASSTCVIAAGEVYCWGGNSRGQLGDSTTINKTTPVKVTQAEGLLAGRVVTNVVADWDHTCAVANSEAYCWGLNTDGQLGDGTTINKTTPVKVTQAEGLLAGKIVTQIVNGYGYTCAIADGEAYCWGLNGANGTLGDGTMNNSSVPVRVVQAEGLLAGKTVTQINLGQAHACAVAGGEVYCWGGNWYGQLGYSFTAQDYSNIPVKVNQSSDRLMNKTVDQLALGEFHNFVIAEGDIYAWGANYDNQLGLDIKQSSLVPLRLPYLLPAAYINSTNGIDRAPSTTPVEVQPRPTFNGRAQPNSTVVVTVHSDPVTCTATANAEGYWECALADDLPEGEHTVYVQVTTPTGDVTNFGPYAVVVAAGASGGPTTITSDTLLAETGISVPVLVSLALSLLAIGTGMLFQHNKRY